MLLPANTSSPASMIAEALGIYKNLTSNTSVPGIKQMLDNSSESMDESVKKNKKLSKFVEQNSSEQMFVN